MNQPRTPYFVELDERTFRLRKLWRVKAFSENFPEFGSWASHRQRLRHRHTNGLVSSGAAIETRFGVLLDHEQYRAWALRPTSSGKEA